MSTKDCEKAFTQIKSIISSDEILVHFDQKLPIILQTDASQDGIADALSHKFADGDLRPVGFVSRKLMAVEKNYSVLDKESLAINWSMKKFYQYLMGNDFIIQTDHKPLLSIFGETKGIPQMAAGRWQRWSLFLSGFSYKIEYIKGENNKIADMLSRHPIQVMYISNDHNVESSYLNLLIQDEIPVNHKQVAIETRRDPTLSKVLNYVLNGWPEEVEQENVIPYLKRRLELTCEQDCVMWGYRVILPQKFRSRLNCVLVIWEW